MQKEIEEVRRERQVLEGRLREAERRDKEMDQWVMEFEEKSKRGAEGTVLLRQLFVSSLTSFDDVSNK